LSSQLPPHEIAALSARIPGLWPPGPYALATAASRVAEALARGSRKRFSCFVVADAGPVRAAVVSLPVEVGPRGVIRVLEPALTRQERTGMENAIERAARR
jgi:malate/lactate dehydrogenase